MSKKDSRKSSSEYVDVLHLTTLSGKSSGADPRPFVHPEDSANWLSKLFVYWINPIITISGQRQLSFDDVWDVPANQSVAHDAKIVWDAWLKEEVLAASENREPSLTQALFVGFGRDFHIAGGLQALFMFSQIAQPYLVGELVNFIQLGEGGTSYGAGISVALFVVSIISSMSFTAGFSILRRLGVSIRSGVMIAVYEKALRLTSASRMQNTIGQTTNLMSIDSEKLFLSAQFLHFVWHGPIANIIVMLLIIQDVGVGSALLGLASQLALLPLQNYLADAVGRVRRTMVKHTDERVKLMNEILQAIRVIKVYAWEVPMEKRVMEVRAKELKCLNLYLSLNAALRELLFIAGPIASIVIFSSLVYGFGQTITLTEMFRVTAFINILRLPSSLLGQALKNLSDARVSAARLTRFFQLPTLPPVSRGELANHPGINMVNASFKWDEITHGGQKESHERTFLDLMRSKMSFNKGNNTPVTATESNKGDKEGKGGKPSLIKELSATNNDTLKNINITSNHPGELIALIGTVGSGKSTLIAAMLKEIPLTGGISSLEGKVAYCAQTPWIQNLSLKDNVLFGEDMNDPVIAAAYEKAIDAAALRPDLAILTDGDQTEIGERGINLSGGQKARVSIARAILAAREAQVVLLDDPFSAVDGATGNWIFEHGILDLLKGRLRVIALNSHRHLLNRFDRVIVMDGGRIVADGPPHEMSPDLLFGAIGIGKSANSVSSDALAELVMSEPFVAPPLDAADSIPKIDGVTKMDGVKVEGVDEIPPYSLYDLDTIEPSIIQAIHATYTSEDCKEDQAMPSPQSPQRPQNSQHSTRDRSSTAPSAKTASTRVATRRDSAVSEKDAKSQGAPEGAKLIAAEVRKKGDVGMDVYCKYFSAAFEGTSAGSSVFNDTGVDSVFSKSHDLTPMQMFRSVLLIIGLVLLFASAQFVRVAVDYSLARWADYGGTVHGDLLNNSWNIAYFVAFGALFLFLAARSSTLNLFAALSAKHIHTDLFRTVVCAPVTTFFDTHTMGEVLNRFSKDTEIVDGSVPEFMMQALTNWAQVFSVFALSLYATPYFALVLFPLMVGFYHIYLKFGAAQRDLKRLEAVSRSPVYASLSETLSGLETIRAYGATDRFLRTHLSRMDFNQKFFFHLWMCTSWLTARLEISTSLILFSISILCVSLRSEISPVALGLALTYGLQLNALFQRVVQVTIDIMSYMISTERVFEYCEIEPEPSTVTPFEDNNDDVNRSGHKKEHSQLSPVREEGDKDLEASSDTEPPSSSIVPPVNTHTNTPVGNPADTLAGTPPIPPIPSPTPSQIQSQIPSPRSKIPPTVLPPDWPSQGIVRFENVWMQYRDNPAVLRGISFSTLPAMRIGICGRTGAGKSSLMIALLRISPLMSGAVYLDGINTASVPLQKLRSVIAIIPQDPVLFTGTIRFQLDPFSQYSDANVWDVLQQVNMAEFVRSTPLGLSEEVFEGGENLSQGQRQLLCIARALLRDARVLIMDEGTSAVDPQTDELIQNVLRDGAMKHGTTVLTIAHRLETIMDFDRILVLGGGEVLEFDSPEVLLNDKNSVFSSMVSEHAAGH